MHHNVALKTSNVMVSFSWQRTVQIHNKRMYRVPISMNYKFNGPYFNKRRLRTDDLLPDVANPFQAHSLLVAHIATKFGSGVV